MWGRCLWNDWIDQSGPRIQKFWKGALCHLICKDVHKKILMRMQVSIQIPTRSLNIYVHTQREGERRHLNLSYILNVLVADKAAGPLQVVFFFPN